MKLRNFRSVTGAVLAALLISCSGTREVMRSDKDLYIGIEFPMPVVQEPAIPGNVVKITDFGGVSGGKVLNSDAFSRAIEAVTQRGGGKVVIPAGIWLTGPIILKSNVELHTETGAIVIFSTNKDLYPLIRTNFEGLDTWRCTSPITGRDLQNIAFTGDGVWDGSGDAWRFVKKSKLTEDQWRKLVASGGYLNDRKDEWYPSKQYKDAMAVSDMNVPANLKTRADFETIRDFLRPVMVSLVNCDRVLLDGPTFQNSPAWCIHPLVCRNLTVRNITVRNPWYSQNGDGIDIESCKDVILYDSSFDVGDDAICIKSGKDKSGRDRGIPSENIVIRKCIVYHGHGGVTIGSEMSGGVKNLHASRCSFIGTDVGLRFKSNRGRGGIVENIYMSDINMIDIPTQAISFDLFYGGRSISEMLESGGMQGNSEFLPVTEETPRFRNIYIRNVTCSGALQAVYMKGLPEMNLENIQLENLTVESEKGISCTDVDQLVIKGLKLDAGQKPQLEFNNARNILVEDPEISAAGGILISIKGKYTENINIKGGKDSKLSDGIVLGTEVSKEQVKF